MKHLNLITSLVLATLLIISTSHAISQTVMKEGKITALPWLDRYYKVKVDNTVYTFMPEVQIDAYFADYSLEKMTPYLAGKFRLGDRVRIARQGFRIYRIEFLDR